MGQGVIICPNCQSSMYEGEPCPECDHIDDITCTCQICSLGEEE